MKRKIIYLLIVLIIIFMGLGIWRSWNKPQTNLNYSISKIKAAYKETWKYNHWQVNFPKVSKLVSYHTNEGWSGDGENLAIFRLTNFSSLVGFSSNILTEDKQTFLDALTDLKLAKLDYQNFSHSLLYKIYKQNEYKGAYFDYFYMIADKQSECLYVLPIHI